VRLLLDSHAFLWFILGDQRLSDRARSAIAAADADADVLISPATL
jgi:PIN domain nuclease of toxin-antitoxin system